MNCDTQSLHRGYCESWLATRQMSGVWHNVVLLLLLCCRMVHRVHLYFHSLASSIKNNILECNRYSLRLKRSWEVGLAAIVNFNTYASTETRYSLDNRTEKDFNKHLHHNRFTIDLQASLRWKAVGAYVKYKPFQVFKKDFGPRFSGISTGITLFY